MHAATEASDRTNAYAAARSGSCPRCSGPFIQAEWADNPDGTARLLTTHCSSCEYIWPLPKPKKDIFVTAHAVDRYRQRLEREGKTGVPYGEDAEKIAQHVREALAAGRKKNHKTDRYQLWGHKRKNLPEGQFFVYTAQGEYAWIIKRDGEQWIVVTSLSPTIAKAA